jgi:DNA-binding XRE family transcriptional regulator
MVKNKLKEILDDRGVKQNWVAEKAGITKQTMSNLINNRFNVSLESAMRIANALNLKIEDIFYIEDL